MKYAQHALFILFVGFGLSIASADVGKPTGFLNDRAGILDADEKTAIESKLKAWKESTSNEFAVLIVNSTDGESHQAYSFRVAEEWAIGDKEKDNGILLLIAIKDRKFYMQVGEGLEGVLPDAKVGQLINNILPSHFRSGDYAGGIDQVIAKTIGIVAGEYTVNQAVGSSSQSAGGGGPPAWLIITIIAIIVIIFLIALCSSGGGGSYIGGGGYSSGYSSSSSSSWGGSSWGGSSGGFGSSSGGFGGFGGGGFSGGGAGGGW